MRRILLGLSIATAAVIALVATGGAHQGHGHPRSAGVGAPRVDTLADGKVVVSLDAIGELAGVVTLTLHPSGNGAYAGDWAFTVAHVDNTDPATGVEPPNEHDHEGEDVPHRDFVRIVHRGALAGSVSGAVVTFDGNGKLADLSAPLTIAQGTEEFSGVSGTGSASLAGLTLAY